MNASATTPGHFAALGFRQGSVVVLVMIFLVLFASLAIAFSAATNMNVRQANSYREAQQARLAAESGVSYTIMALRQVTIAPQEAQEDLLLALANRIAYDLDGTVNVIPGEVTFNGMAIGIPSVALGNGQSFDADIREGADPDYLLMTVNGHYGSLTRTIRMHLIPITEISRVFDYGIASRGKILIGGDGTVAGVNDDDEADVLSATYSDPEAIVISGSCQIDGDLYTSNPDSTVSVTGNPTVGGDDKSSIAEHIHIGVGEVDFPEIEVGLYESFATTVIDHSTDTSSDMVLENVRILANSNLVFAGNVTVNGIVYIEQPNNIKFTANADVTGIIVTEDAGDNAYADNLLEFTGNMNVHPVESLPDLPQFHDLREMAGSAILAPGFGVKMTGNFGVVSGAIVADQFTITGNCDGTIYGPVICYGDSEFTLWGSSSLRIDRSKYDNELPGFRHPVHFYPDPESYTEVQ